MGDISFGLTHDEWMETVAAATAVAIAIVVAVLVTGLARRIVHAFTGSTEGQLDEQIASGLRWPFVLLMTIWATVAASNALSYAADHRAEIRHAGVALSILVVAVAARRVIMALLKWQARRPGVAGGRLHPGSLPLIQRGSTILIYAIALLLVLDTLGVAISPMLAGLGIGGLAVALALQPLLANIFASSYMLSDSSIRIGDWIEIDGGPVGYVDDIGWRATRIRSFDNNVVIVPNSRLAESTVTNYSLTDLQADTRVVTGVAYEEDLERVERLLVEMMTALRDEWPTTVKNYAPIVRFTDFGESNIGILLMMRALTWGDSFLLRHELTKRVHAMFRREGIVVNYPARRLFLQHDDVEGLDRLVREPTDEPPTERPGTTASD